MSFTVNTPALAAAQTISAASPGNAAFPDPPTGGPGAITTAAPPRTQAAGDATALGHCQAEIKRLRHAWEEAKRRQAANAALALKLANAITPATKPDDATRLTSQATTASHQSTDAGREADWYARKAATTLTEFRHRTSADQTPVKR